MLSWAVEVRADVIGFADLSLAEESSGSFVSSKNETKVVDLKPWYLGQISHSSRLSALPKQSSDTDRRKRLGVHRRATLLGGVHDDEVTLRGW
jgi:hypothetical protein